MYKTIHDVTLASLQKHCTLIHYFGLGFIQIKLGPTYRMHFYTSELPGIVGEEDVHNHRYDFTSLILYGTFNQDIFIVEDGDTRELMDESCKKDSSSPMPIPKPCTIKKIMTQTFTEGSSYFIGKNVFHRVRATNAITLLTRAEIEKDFAQVIHKKNTLNVCPFSKVIPEKTLWLIVESMLNQAKTNASL